MAVDSCRKNKINQNSIIILDNIDTDIRTNWAKIQNHSLGIDPYACFFAGIRIYHKKSPLTKIFKTNKGGRGVNRHNYSYLQSPFIGGRVKIKKYIKIVKFKNNSNKKRKRLTPIYWQRCTLLKLSEE